MAHRLRDMRIHIQDRSYAPQAYGMYRPRKWAILLELGDGVTVDHWDKEVIRRGAQSVLGYSRFLEKRDVIELY